MIGQMEVLAGQDFERWFGDDRFNYLDTLGKGSYCSVLA